jgi:ABC-type sugar transport system substrate-binding protein
MSMPIARSSPTFQGARIMAGPFSSDSSIITTLSTPLERRTFLRGLGGLGAAGAVGSFLAACGSSSTKTSTPSSSASSSGGIGKGKTIAVVLNGNNAYTTYLAAGVLHALEGTEYEFKGVQNNFDSSVELSNIQSLLSQGVSGIVVLPVSSATVAKAAQLAFNKGVPFGNALYPGKSDADKYFTGVAALDSTKGGELIGDYLLKNGKPGKVIVVQGIVGQGFSEFIDAGFDKTIKGSGFSVAVRQQGMYDRQKAIDIVQAGLAAHPDVTAIVSHAASMSDGIASFLKQKGLKDLTHISSDGDDDLFPFFGTPYLTADRYYSSAQTGVIATQAVRAKLEGKTFPFATAIDQVIVTADTYKAELAKNPYNYPQYKSRVAKL